MIQAEMPHFKLKRKATDPKILRLSVSAPWRYRCNTNGFVAGNSLVGVTLSALTV